MRGLLSIFAAHHSAADERCFAPHPHSTADRVLHNIWAAGAPRWIALHGWGGLGAVDFRTCSWLRYDVPSRSESSSRSIAGRKRRRSRRRTVWEQVIYLL